MFLSNSVSKSEKSIARNFAHFINFGFKMKNYKSTDNIIPRVRYRTYLYYTCTNVVYISYSITRDSLCTRNTVVGIGILRYTYNQFRAPRMPGNLWQVPMPCQLLHKKIELENYCCKTETECRVCVFVKCHKTAGIIQDLLAHGAEPLPV